jgi:outer membrane autotransporter protein
MSSEFSSAHRARLCVAIAAALSLPAMPAVARDLTRGENVTIRDTPPGAEEAWSLRQATLTVAPGGRTLAIQAYQSVLNMDTAVTTASTGDAVLVRNGSTLTMLGSQVTATVGTGLQLSSDGGIAGSGDVNRAVVSRSSITGGRFGASVANAGELTLDVGTSVTATSGAGLLMADGTATIKGGSIVRGSTNGILILGESRFADIPAAGRHVVIDGSSVSGGSGAAISVGPRDPAQNTSDIVMQNGASLIAGADGRALEALGSSAGSVVTSLTATGSTINGGVVATGTAGNAPLVTLGLLGNTTMTGDLTATGGHIDATVENSMLNGAATGDINIALSNGGTWNMRADSDVVGLALNGGSAVLGDGTAYRTLNVNGSLSGTGGGLVLHTQLNEGGAVTKQFTDRLLVHGDVTTTGTTVVTVKPTGEGALTDANRNGVVDSNEGISLIQVAGASRRDAFVVAGGYVAAGPWQYTLHAFGPGEVDPSQSQLGGPFQWDYRLGNRYVEDCGDHCSPVDPVDPVNPVDPVDPVRPGDPDPVDRAAVVPQLPAYMLAPMALQNYGNTLNDGLHQRLGEVRDSVYGANVGGEVFARYIGSQLNYSRNLSFQRFGYDFDQQINALQVGGGIVAVDGDQGSLRAGWALDSGTTRVTPSAADGNSRAKYYANGGSAWATFQHASGFWVDGVLGTTRYHGDVSTDLRGGDVGKLHAQGWTMSIETGVPMALGGDWTVEPQFQVRLQQLNFRDFRDKDAWTSTWATRCRPPRGLASRWAARRTRCWPRMVAWT